MPKHSKFAIVIAAALLVHCSARGAEILQLPRDKVLLNISFPEKDRLLATLGFTNPVTSGVFRDSMGAQIFIPVEPGPQHSQTERTQKLVVVTAQGARIEPWHSFARNWVTDNAKVAVWQDATQAGRSQVRSGEWLPTNCVVEAVSGDWIAVARSGCSPWVARLDTPTVVAAQLPDSPGLIAIYATGQVVHVFTRRGWRNAEGPMRYLLYDFAHGSKPVKDMVMPSWARITLDMDPATGLAVINDNNRFWGKSWLFDINTRKRKWISTSDWTLVVNKGLAEKWIALTKR